MSRKWLTRAGLIIGGAFLFGGCLEMDGSESSPKDEQSMLVMNATVSYDNDSAIVTGLVNGVETSITGASIENRDETDNDLELVEEPVKCYFCVEGDGTIICRQVACP